MTTPLNSIGSLALPMIDGAGAAAGTGKSSGFGSVLRGKLDELAQSQQLGEQAATDLATNRAEDVAQSMVRIEQANVTLQMATQIRNKAIEAYQEILRMQI